MTNYWMNANLNTFEKISFLKRSLDIDLLEDALDIEVVKEMGDEDICRCPLPSHNGYDANPSFSINRSKLVYNCFACGIGGNIIDLVARVKDIDYDQAYDFCKTYQDGTANKDNPFAFQEKLEQIFAEHEQHAAGTNPLPRFSKSILTPWVSDYSEYFLQRGINKDSQDKFLLGYDPHHKRGNYTGPAAIIPHFFQDALVGYQERWLDENRPKSIPKYTNSHGFPKKETLFGYDIVWDGNNTGSVVVVESAITAIYLDQMGYPAVATFGAQVTDEQIALLRSFSWGVILAFDNDQAGATACDMVGNRLKKTIPVHVLPVFGNEKADLNDLSESGVADIMRQARPWFLKEL
jgi:DNA primase